MCGAIASNVDLLTTTEQEDQVWPVLRTLTGRTLPTYRFSEPPKFFTPLSLLLADETVARATEQRAPCDWHLYQLAEVRTQSMLSEWAALGGNYRNSEVRSSISPDIGPLAQPPPPTPVATLNVGEPSQHARQDGAPI